MSELLKNQKFGVEVEFTGISRKLAAETIAKVLNSAASAPERNCYLTRTIKDNQNRKWKVMRDSSISSVKKVGSENLDEYKVEFVTPPLNYKDIETLQEIIRALKEAGAVPHSSCGIHIHVDGANHTALSLRRMVCFMTARQDLIYEALGTGRRKNRWCKPICENLKIKMKQEKDVTIDKVEKIWYSNANDNYYGRIDHSHYNETRYHGLNLHSYFSKGTVEFRLFNSTLHAGRIKAYIQFCLALSAWSIEANDRIVFRGIENYTAHQKVTIMRNILTDRLGLYGDEFKTCRYHMLAKLKEKDVAQHVA